MPLDRVHSRDEVVRMANAGQLGRLNDLEKPLAVRLRQNRRGGNVSCLKAAGVDWGSSPARWGVPHYR
jgi:hypothetical protein